MKRHLVNIAYVSAVLAVFAAFPGAAVIGGLVTLPVLSFLDRPLAIVLVPTAAACILGGLVIPMTRLLGPEAIPFYAAVSGGTAALLAGLHLIKLAWLGEGWMEPTAPRKEM